MLFFVFLCSAPLAFRAKNSDLFFDFLYFMMDVARAKPDVPIDAHFPRRSN